MQLLNLIQKAPGYWGVTQYTDMELNIADRQTNSATLNGGLDLETLVLFLMKQSGRLG